MFEYTHILKYTNIFKYVYEYLNTLKNTQIQILANIQNLTYLVLSFLSSNRLWCPKVNKTHFQKTNNIVTFAEILNEKIIIKVYLYVVISSHFVSLCRCIIYCE